jgi:hypothetical protein
MPMTGSSVAMALPSTIFSSERVTAQYDELYGETIARNAEATESLFAPGVVQNVRAVADEILRVIDLPNGQRPYRSSVDFSDFGDVPVGAVAEAQRVRPLTRMGLADTISPAQAPAPTPAV